MPNWCYTSCIITGDSSEINDLYDMLESLENREQSLVENGFGKTWLGNIVTQLGEDWNKIFCRGLWLYLEIIDENLYLDVESAWRPPTELFDLIHSKFPNIWIYYQAEEPGVGLYETNDDTLQYFPQRYSLSLDDEIDYYEDGELDIMLTNLSDYINKKVNNLEEAFEAIEEYMEENGDSFVAIHQYEIV